MDCYYDGGFLLDSGTGWFISAVQEGIQEGMGLGIGKRNLEIAALMKADGESLEKIIKYTALSKEEIERL